MQGIIMKEDLGVSQTMNKDELKKAMEDIQKLTDTYVARADAKASAKEKEIMDL